MHLLTQTLRSLVKNTSGKRASFLAVIPRALSLLAPERLRDRECLGG